MSRVVGPEGELLPGAILSHHRPWIMALASVATVVGILLVVYWETALSMGRIWWSSETYAHGFVVVPLSLYMIWTRRSHLAPLRPGPVLWPLPLFALLVLIWLVASLVDVNVVRQLAFVAMIVTAVVTMLGTRVSWMLSFPLAYLFFAVPVGADLEPVLMDFTTVFTVDLLRITGVPVYVEGRFLTTPTGHWEVAEACSGIRYLIASVALGTLYAYLTYARIWKRVLFIGLSVLVPILANGLRAYGIVMLGHLSDMKLATGVDHIIYGWIFFGVVMLLLFWLGSFFRDDERPAPAEPPVRPGSVPVSPKGASITATSVAVLALLLLSAAGPVSLNAAVARDGQDRNVELAFPTSDGVWEGPLEPSMDLEPAFREASAIGQVAYRSGPEVVDIVHVHYSSDGSGELISHGNQLYDEEKWRRVSQSALDTGAALGPGKVLELRLRRGSREYLVWWWYDIHGYPTTSRYLGKVLEGWGRLRGAAGGSSLLAVAAPFEHRPEEARASLSRFLDEAARLLDPERLVRASVSSGASGG